MAMTERDLLLDGIRTPACKARFTAKIKTYPDGSTSILAANRPIFVPEGWESDDKRKKSGKNESIPEEVRKKANYDRTRRRASAALRDLALCNDFRFFVTLTVADQKKRYDVKEMTRILNQWLDNCVRRNGLTYVLVPELHKDGAIHYHGLFNDALPVEYSGTVIPPEGGKPRRPRSNTQMRDWLEKGGHIVYNLPRWPHGFTTAIELYGDRNCAIQYVCKYIGKTTERVGGRWYYSGGDLKRPEVHYNDTTIDDVAQDPESAIFEVKEAGLVMAYQFIDLGGMKNGN